MTTGHIELLRILDKDWLYVGIEFKMNDFWIGAYYSLDDHVNNIWVCIIPMLPIHFKWRIKYPED